jgi:hypothetical protein
METHDLLAVTPKQMVEYILRRREATEASLPEELKNRTQENDRAYQLAREAKILLDELEANLGADDGPTSEHIEQAKAKYDENETFRRRTMSRLWLVKNAIADQDEALRFWNEIDEGTWGHLLEDAERVRNGGPSSYALGKVVEGDEEGSA